MQKPEPEVEQEQPGVLGVYRDMKEQVIEISVEKAKMIDQECLEAVSDCQTYQRYRNAHYLVIANTTASAVSHTRGVGWFSRTLHIIVVMYKIIIAWRIRADNMDTV